MKKLTSELLGTFALVFAGTGAIVIDDVSHGAVSHAGVALTFGLIVLAMIYAFGDISGAHLNPVFPDVTQRLHWGFPDPSSFEGTWNERLEQTRKVRNMIEAKVNEWCQSVCEFNRA